MKTRLIVRAMIVRDGLALVNDTKSGPRLLGGKVKRDESLQEALERELLEEIGCRAVVGEIVNVTERRRKSMREITLVFKATVVGEPLARENQITLAWIPRGQVCGWNNVIRFQAA